MDMRTILIVCGLSFFGCATPRTTTVPARDGGAPLSDAAPVADAWSADAVSFEDAATAPDAYVTPDAWTMPACDLWTEAGCSSTQSCRGDGRTNRCVPAGTVAQFVNCGGAAGACMRGLFCTAGQCVRPCDAEHACPSDGVHTWRCVGVDEACSRWDSPIGFCLIADPGFYLPPASCSGPCTCAP